MRPPTSSVHLRLRRHEILLTPWPALDAFSRRRGTATWQPMRDARLRLPRLEAVAGDARRTASQLDLFADQLRVPGDALALADLIAEIPPTVRGVVAAYGRRQHALLQLAAVDDRAWQLLLPHRHGGNPGLAFALAQRLTTTDGVAERARLRALVMARRPTIARALGFPGSRTALRALARVRPGEVDEQLPLHLAMALDRDAALPWIRRLDRTSTVASCVLWRWRRLELLTPAFLEDCANYYGSAAPSILHQLRRYMLRGGGALRPVHSVEELHARVRKEVHDPWPRHFPGPPLSFRAVGGELRLVPLCTPEALVSEGREMEHCIARHARRIAWRQDLYAYRLEGADRGSVLLERRGGWWRVAEMRGIRNRPLTETTRLWVRAEVLRAQGRS